MVESMQNVALDLSQRFPCRELQIRQLLCLLSVSISSEPHDCVTDSLKSGPSPSSLVLHGLEATGKSTIIRSLLETINVSHAIIRNQECITGRHLLEQTLSACLDAIERDSIGVADKGRYTRCENSGALLVQLQKLLSSGAKFVLVFDGIDHQRETPPTLLQALARFGEFVCLMEHELLLCKASF